MIRTRRLLPFLALAVLALSATAGEVRFTGPVGASVRVDGHELGLLPLAPMELPVGVYEVSCRARGYEHLDQTLLVPEGDAVVHVRLRPLVLRRGRAMTGSLLYAGLGQWYSGARWRGWLYFTGETVGLLSALSGELGRVNARDDYINARRNYELAVEPGQINYWRRQADQYYQDVADLEDLRNLGLMIAAGSWALSLLDAWLLFPSADVGPGPVPPTPAAQALNAPTSSPVGGLHAAVTLTF